MKWFRNPQRFRETFPSDLQRVKIVNLNLLYYTKLFQFVKGRRKLGVRSWELTLARNVGFRKSSTLKKRVIPASGLHYRLPFHSSLLTKFHHLFRCTFSSLYRSVTTGGGFAGRPTTMMLCATTDLGKLKYFRNRSIRSSWG